MSSRHVFGALAALLLAACSPGPKVHPALWQVDGPDGQRAWLFGTIHALPYPVDYRSAAFRQARGQADSLVMEVAAIDDDRRIGAIFARLATTPGQPPLEARVPAELRGVLARLLANHGTAPDQFDTVETWAAALQLNQLLEAKIGSDSGNGIDRALLKDFAGKPVGEFEGAEAQLAVFDRLPEDDQRALLAAVIRTAPDAGAEAHRLEMAWMNGDVASFAAEDHRGMLADPELREALLVGRNRAFAARLTALLKAHKHPFVAIGALHLAGADGLPAQLVAEGYTVTRIQ